MTLFHFGANAIVATNTYEQELLLTQAGYGAELERQRQGFQSIGFSPEEALLAA